MTDAGYLTIGKVVKKLQQTYPDLSVSKVRYLQDEGLLNPSRTPSGYRLYSQRDVRRLETILYLQKNRFLPLSVIKEELDRADSGQAPEVEATLGRAETVTLPADDEETAGKLHPIDRMPGAGSHRRHLPRVRHQRGLCRVYRPTSDIIVQLLL